MHDLNCSGDRSERANASRYAVTLGWIVLGMLAGIATAWSGTAQPTRIIVKWKATDTRGRAQTMSSLRSHFRQSTGIELTTRRALSERLDVMELQHLSSGAEFDQVLARLRNQPDVEYAVPDQRRQIAVLPNDQYITGTSGRSQGQWYLLNTEPASIDAYTAWDYSKSGASIGSGVIVAVVDTGVRFDHPDLAGKLLPGFDFVSCDQANCTGQSQTFLTANDGDGWDADASDPGDWVNSADLQNHADVFPADRCTVENSSWHGTRVAGMIGAATNNALGIAGTGWNARILPVRALGKCGGYDSDIIAGMRWAAGLPVPGAPVNANPARVINLSLGGDGACSSLYADAIAQLTALGVSVVASAGNDSAIVNTPANCSGVIAVVGVRNTGTKVGFSSLGNATVAAPAGNCGTASGLCLYSLDTTTNLGLTTPGANDYTDQSNANLGTSFSAPIVSGTVALMLGMNPALTPAQIISVLRSSSKPFPQTAATTCQIPTDSTPLAVNQNECNCTTSTCGAGLVNAYQAVLAVSSGASSSSSSSTNSSSASSVTVNAPAAANGGGGAVSWDEVGWLAVLLLVTQRRRIQSLRAHAH